MGKIRTRIIGLENIEEEQKKEQKSRSAEKKAKKTKDSEVEEVDQDVKAAKKESKKTDVKEQKNAEESETAVKKSVTGKKHIKAQKLVDPKKVYSLAEAVKLLKKMKYAEFDESVELHFNLDEQGLRGEVDLPHSIGKVARVKIVDDAVLGAIEKGIIDFDILISHPSHMPKLSKFAKVLGPRGLMPNPKAGTVSTNPEETMKKFAKGVIKWKSEPKFPLLHQLIGKISYKEQDIEENVRQYIASVGKVHIKKAFIKTTMSPSVRFDIES